LLASQISSAFQIIRIEPLLINVFSSMTSMRLFHLLIIISIQKFLAPETRLRQSGILSPYSLLAILLFIMIKLLINEKF
jgi:hypothetical protein